MNMVWGWLRRAAAWIAARLKDVLYLPGNEHASFARILTWLGIALYIAVIWFAVVVLNQPVDFLAIAGGYAMIAGIGTGTTALQDIASSRARPSGRVRRGE